MKSVNIHYYIGMIVEGSALVVMIVGTWELCRMGSLNPSEFLIQVGSVMGFVGAAYFAKFIKWNRK